MVGRVTRETRTLRGYRPAPVAVSAFTVFVVLFAQLYQLLFIFLSLTQTHCQQLAFWTADWAEGGSPFQLMAAALAAMGVLFVVRTVALSTWRRHLAETIFQGALIAALCFTLVVWRSVMFPYAAPGHAFMVRYGVFNYDRFLLPAEAQTIWPDDGADDRPPPLPFGYAIQFKSSASPTWRELQDAQACAVSDLEMFAAYEQWWEDYEARAYRANNYGDGLGD